MNYFNFKNEYIKTEIKSIKKYDIIFIQIIYKTYKIIKITFALL